MTFYINRNQNIERKERTNYNIKLVIPRTDKI